MTKPIAGGRGISRADANRAVRQEALREQLEKGGHVQHVVEMAQQIANLEGDLDSLQVQRLKIASEIKLNLIDRYFPRLKQVEHTVDGNVNVTNIDSAEEYIRNLEIIDQYRQELLDES